MPAENRCLKTVGLLQYMFQCGLLALVSELSEFGIFHNLFIDIGDEQSIENDLSTYSSHLKNMDTILKHADDRSLFNGRIGQRDPNTVVLSLRLF